MVTCESYLRLWCTGGQERYEPLQFTEPLLLPEDDPSSQHEQGAGHEVRSGTKPDGHVMEHNAPLVVVQLTGLEAALAFEDAVGNVIAATLSFPVSEAAAATPKATAAVDYQVSELGCGRQVVALTDESDADATAPTDVDERPLVGLVFTQRASLCIVERDGRCADQLAQITFDVMANPVVQVAGARQDSVAQNTSDTDADHDDTVVVGHIARHTHGVGKCLAVIVATSDERAFGRYSPITAGKPQARVGAAYLYSKDVCLATHDHHL